VGTLVHVGRGGSGVVGAADVVGSGILSCEVSWRGILDLPGRTNNCAREESLDLSRKKPLALN